MNEKQNDLPKLKMKLSLKKETLRTFGEAQQSLLDGVVGGTDLTTLATCPYTGCPCTGGGTVEGNLE